MVELATGRAGGYEALTRIDVEPRRGPDEWFAQAHRVGLGEELEALAMRAALAVPGRPDGTFLALNVSPRALLSAPVQAALPDDLTGIVIELTEHEVFGAEGELETELASLRARGARVALDDAGAGYAGLQQIIRIAPDILKLDRTLVHGAHADASRQALLEALIGFASSTGAAICAEGVEDLDDLRALVSLDVTYAQGYGLCRPGPPWPVLHADAAALGAAEIRGGLRVALSPRGVTGAFAGGLAELSDHLAAATTISDLGAANLRAADLLGADEIALMLVDGDDARARLGQPRQRRRHPLAARGLPRHPATSSSTASRARSSPATRRATPPSSPSWPTLGHGAVLILPVVYGNQTLAVLEVYRHPRPGLHHPRDRPRPRARPAVRRGARPPLPKGACPAQIKGPDPFRFVHQASVSASVCSSGIVGVQPVARVQARRRSRGPRRPRGRGPWPGRPRGRPGRRRPRRARRSARGPSARRRSRR